MISPVPATTAATAAILAARRREELEQREQQCRDECGPVLSSTCDSIGHQTVEHPIVITNPWAGVIIFILAAWIVLLHFRR